MDEGGETSEVNSACHAASSTLPSAVQVNIDQELPFLVTNWLAQYGTTLSASNTSNEQAEGRTGTSAAAIRDSDSNRAEMDEQALLRIRHAASELAAAFSSLGAFGTALRPNLSSFASENEYMVDDNDEPQQHQFRKATFADAKRQWSKALPANQLESLVQGATIGSVSGQQALPKPIHLLDAAQEQFQHSKHYPESGRTLLDAIAQDETHDNLDKDGPFVASALQRPMVVRFASNRQRKVTAGYNPAGTGFVVATQNASSVTLVSDIVAQSTTAANSLREFLNARNNLQRNQTLRRTLRKSIAMHRNTLNLLAQRRGNILSMDGSESDMVTKLKLLDEVKESEENSNRVIQQLERQLGILEPAIRLDALALVNLEAAAREMFVVLQHSIACFRDLATEALEPGKLGNPLVRNILARQAGLIRPNGRKGYRSIGIVNPQPVARENRLAIIKSRFSHAVTINTHLAFPVFCLRFDRTGQYFITGADDYLAKLFCLGANIRPKGNTINHASLHRGAVLVCTLRGHAGVINDIDVSSDNAFLATASEDGDCRIWGLTDGCPVAILRGHKDGCNMVSWSTTTPYRLVTAAADGHARCWDVREACLRRYRRFIGKRPEYQLNLTETTAELQASPAALSDAADGAFSEPPLPPLPVRLDEPLIDAAAVNNGAGVSNSFPHLPPSPRENDSPIRAVLEQQNDFAELGQFVANDALDEGVQLLDKLRHGASLEEQLAGPGTRARRSPIKVICVARCPHGGHFATGSDDGICRIWKDEDDERIRQVDMKHLGIDLYEEEGYTRRRLQTAREGVTNSRHLLDLKGHFSAVTDLHYSSRGDRLLSASQKDGIVRIWSWNADPASPQVTKVTSTHIVIKLTHPVSTTATAVLDGPRRRPVRTSVISCDVAVWVCDDSKIVTSQCEPIKQRISKIAAGSQYLFIWDSRTGDCLLGIHGAHSMQCPVVVPHPTDSTIFCSAGSDGVLKLWDADAGTCFFTFSNKIDFGPAEAQDCGKTGGFLDGAFSPDGTSLVVTDDSGRVSLFDCALVRSAVQEWTTPGWMKEQYFSNDYYDLKYDAHGYCVEGGSGLPPHLAPKGVRRAHGDVSWPDYVNDSFRTMVGPLPLEERAARCTRMQMLARRSASYQVQYLSRGNIISQYDLKSAIMLHSDGSGATAVAASTGGIGGRVSVSQASSPRNSGRLSSNWRWGDAFNDLPDDGIDDDDADGDDEDFVIGSERRSSGRLGRLSILQDSDDDEHNDDDDDSHDSNAPRRSGRRAFDDDDDDSGAGVLEYMSTNNHPSGPFAGDYETYFFRMGSEREARTLSRTWLRRPEGDSSYTGTKIYSPQLGDTVVYIPRAHQETIVAFPSLSAPWQNWPEGAAWPVLQCCIRHVRYRFPFKSYYKRGNTRCKSIVAVLTLEVTGLPVLSQEGVFCPAFASSTIRHSFEVSLFENDEPDYLIPIELFMARTALVDGALAHLDEVPHPQIEAMYRSDSTANTAMEDEEFVPWRGHIERLIDDDDLNESGFDALEVTWASSSDTDKVSAWEITLVGADPRNFGRPRLSDEEAHTAHDALTKLLTLASSNASGIEYQVEHIFGGPVDETQYSDYSTRVEIPMDLSFVSLRLAAGYYGSILSLVSDIRLIRDNCAKYNGDHDPMTRLADDMVKQFEETVLSEEQRECLAHFRAVAAANASLLAGPIPAEATRNESSIRIAVRNRSILEDFALPPPSATQLSRRSSRAARRQQSREQGYESSGLRRSTRQVGRFDDTAAANDHAHGSLWQIGHGGGRSRLGLGRTGSARSATVDNFSQHDIDDTRQSTMRNGRLRGAGGDATNRTTLERVSGRPSSRRQVRQPAHGADSLGRASRQLEASRRSAVALRSHGSTSLNHTEGDVDLPSPRAAPFRNQHRLNSSDELDEDNSDSDEASDTSESEGENGSVSGSSRQSSTHRQRGTRFHKSPVSSRGRLGSSTSYTQAAVDSANDDSDEEEVVEESDSENSEKESISKTRVHRTRKSIVTTLRSRSKFASRTSNESGDEVEEKCSDSIISVTRTKGRAANTRLHRNDAAARQLQPEAVTSPNCAVGRRRMTQKSYVDPSSSEFDEEGQDGSDSDGSHEAEPPKRHKPDNSNRATKRLKFAIPSPAPAMTRGKSWAFLDKKKITAVGSAILDKLEAEDMEGIFAVPVAEAFPEVAKDYLKTIKEPMDFRTIREDRLPWYHSADQLRVDLLLIFDNCIAYNEDDSEFAALARLMIDQLDDIFKGVCEKEGIRLPRRW
ncbi:hypothetical protein MPSEU_000577100 [Mayamaea pseudoterrestris]|nr:hypothetical protein MPSEU_000577100 [Mayamaea pseudoterrestris]